jgi:hypothetical protein
MTQKLPRFLRSVEAKPGFRLVVTSEDGDAVLLDFNAVLRRGGVFKSLRDEALFRRVRLGERHRTIEWPEPADPDGAPLIDIDAESLFMMAAEQRVSPAA